MMTRIGLAVLWILGAAASICPAQETAGGRTRDDPMVAPFGGQEYQPAAGEPYYCTNALTAQACRFITAHERDHGDRRLFLYVPYSAGHWRMQALEREFAR